MQVNLQGKNILVTGASRGIGKAIARQLLSSGAQVAIHYGKNKSLAEELAQEFPNRTQVLSANLGEPQECKALFEQTLEAFGKLDVLINNAGVALKSPVDIEDQLWLSDWEKTMAVNLSASAILSRLFVNYLLDKQTKGRLIHIASRAAFRGDTAEYLAYAASKGGMVALSRSIARAYGKNGIKSFVIAPGFIETDMAREFMDLYGEGHALNDIVLDKLTQPEDLAPMVTLLASGLADHATGSTIDINAGSYIR